MGRVVICIVAVFLLDLAFMLFLQGGGDLVELARALRLVSADPALVSQAVHDPEVAALNDGPSKDIDSVRETRADSVVPPGNPVRKATPTRVRSIKRNEVIRQVRSLPRRSYVARELAEPFSDTVIWVHQASYVPEEQIERVETPRNNSTRPPAANFAPVKRSFFSRARPVVKKPYDWVKAFSSKIF